MIVEPAPAAPRGRRHRVAWVVGIVLPVILLVSAVTAGLAGPREDLPAPTTPAIAQAAASPGSPSGVPGPTREPVLFPTVAADLAVLSIPDAAARINLVTPGPFAVAGYLSEVGAYPPCAAAKGDTRGDLGPLCVRHARLEALPDGGDAGSHMDLTIAAGTRMPATFERLGGAGRPVPVVLVGRYGPRLAPCHPTIYECNGSLLVERVTWSDGEPFDPGPVFDAGLEVPPYDMAYRNLDSAETLAIGGSGTILMAALVRPSTVPVIDSAAARTLTVAKPPGTLVWYVRGLETGYDVKDPLHGSAPPRYSWVVLDYDSGATLARGRDTAFSP